MTIAPGEADTMSAETTPTGTAVGVREGSWVRACSIDDLIVGRGVAVLGPDGVQAALFRLPAAESDREAAPGRSRLYAIGNIDPFGRAAVLSRGLTGDRGGEPTVASPLGKQVFALRTGLCLDDETVSVPSYGVRVSNRIVEVYFPA
ncbi:nitrite reductase small subunit NirD [Gordonia terrae]|uniref:Nitrite reductase (NAD(P)H) small subunit n=3 Tax=Gordonia TaxID=2053 RepID=A0A2I1R7G5_9ACTN|nr:nitrite reductase small subunit [Gordonia terrae]VTR10977.1 Nitrite reductase [NAD(P)H] small subunit [Clostridioides difficile]GAB46541.1 nitrite reductase small subunit [Gordonia terrae NBRC 100016]AWO85202.1 nitrite reductase (NAD(P)H) small subunit [Gordonia terrae]PKZ65056.1 nitrite reductase (NAD(P)H) small subunit [Gordonia terrae]